MPEERLSPYRAVRVLRAKAGELEAQVLAEFDRPSTVSAVQIAELAVDVALVATLIDDHIEDCERGDYRQDGP